MKQAASTQAGVMNRRHFLFTAATEATASKQTFNPRWTLCFTPHSAAIEPSLIAQARGAWWWNEAPCRFDVANIRAGVKKARDANCTGYVPSLARYSYEQLSQVRALAARHRHATSDGAKELHHIAQWLADQWSPDNTQILANP